MASFFYEPAKGIVHGPEDFAKGLGIGTVNLIKNSMYGLFHTMGNVSEAFGKVIAAVSLDDDFYHRYKYRPRTKTVY